MPEVIGRLERAPWAMKTLNHGDVPWLVDWYRQNGLRQKLDADGITKGLVIYRRVCPDQGAYASYEGGKRWVQECLPLPQGTLLEGLNEVSVANLKAFTFGFIEECVRWGLVPVVWSFAVGNPPESEFPDLVQMAQVALSAGAYFASHAYGGETVLWGWDFFAGRMTAKILPYLGSRNAIIPPSRVVYTEAGWDVISNQSILSGRGWRSLVGKHSKLTGRLITKQDLMDDLRDLAQQLVRTGVAGATLYTFRRTDDEWQPFDFADDQAWLDFLVDHISRWQPADPPPPPPPSRKRVRAKSGINSQTGRPWGYINERRAPRAGDQNVLTTIQDGQEFEVDAAPLENGFLRVVAYVAPGVVEDVPEGPRFLWPLRLPVDKQIVTHPWHEERHVPPTWYHEGLDFYAPMCTPVLAGLAGTVTAVRNVAGNWAYGKRVIVRSAINGVTYDLYYCHLDECTVQVGQVVAAGDVLGTSGTTGNSTGPHLHVTAQQVGQHNGEILDGAIDFTTWLVRG